jgi:hypothetical protein
MRTTLTIDDDVLELARCMAQARGITLGEAVSILARRGIPKVGLKRSESGILVFDVPEDFPVVNDETVRKLLDEGFP